jgi:hypothetical protein
MKNQVLALLICASLTGQSMAATIQQCKYVNLSGECTSVSVANDGKCRECPYINISEALYLQKP